MEVFARVTECESFSRAAESLELANATVTSCVRNLESISVSRCCSAIRAISG
ncbi:LysR family transcriptional regulator [Cupriavidus sp. CuC1]|uniref:LysR family transcriptional regulator n=1 Tax=Cupriavidus sp. CuC1 TaxID=3373131 RepID=UPI0037CFB65B